MPKQLYGFAFWALRSVCMHAEQFSYSKEKRRHLQQPGVTYRSAGAEQSVGEVIESIPFASVRNLTCSPETSGISPLTTLSQSTHLRRPLQ
jgi:hypothetical protein